MALRSWWLRSKLKRIERKLAIARAQQRQLRKKEDDASKQRIHAVTEEIHRLTADEERIRGELAEADAGAPST